MARTSKSTVTKLKLKTKPTPVGEKGTKQTTAKPKVLSVKLTLPVVTTNGTPKGSVQVSTVLFGAKINRPLIAQAVRVYLANQRTGGAHTKTRGEVVGSTRKIYRQKGTGRARHGGIRAPIFVGGGIAFGPRHHSFHLDMPVKMKRAALYACLTSRRVDGDIMVVDGLDDLEVKTKAMALAFSKIAGESHILFVANSKTDSYIRAIRNIHNVDILPPESLNTYSVLSHQKIVFTKKALSLLIGSVENKKSV